MLASHATKRTVRYRYYVSRSLQLGGDNAKGLRFPAREIEAAVRSEVAAVLDDPLLLASRLSLDISPALLRQMTDACETLSAELRAKDASLRQIVAQVRALPDQLEIEIDTAKLGTLLGSSVPACAAALTLNAPYRLTRTGRAMRLVQHNGQQAGARQPDMALVKLIVQARRWWGMLTAGKIDITMLAEQEGVNDSYVTRVLRAAFLSPEVTDAIITGRQHGELDAAKLRATGGIPACWREQRVRFVPGECG